MADVIWAGIGACLISDRTLTLFRSHALTGFEVLPADVRLMFPHAPEEAIFWQLYVSGWGGIASPASGIHQIRHPTGGKRLAYSAATDPAAIIDQTQWDGSDFFIVWPLPMFWWVTPKVVATLESHNLKRYHLVPQHELTFSLSNAELGFRPGRLRHYFVEERARQIGEPLGIY